MLQDIIGPILALLFAGFVGRKAGIFTERRVSFLNKAAFYVALPALVLHSIYSRSIGEIWSPSLVLGFISILLLTFVTGWIWFRRFEDREMRSVATIQSYHGNIGYMGLPIVTMGLGAAAGAKASLILGLGSIIQIPLTVWTLVYLNDREAKFFDQAKKILLNPVLMALVLGLFLSFFEISLPETADTAIGLLSRSALPIAMYGVGASIRIEGGTEHLNLTGSVIGLKMVLMPVLGVLLFSILGVESSGLGAGVLMLSMPPAISTFIYSKELGGDEELASLNLSITTILSILSISLVLFVFG